MGSNPFTYGNPIGDPLRFFGRMREIEQVFDHLRNPGFMSSSIVGDRRIGKTSLLSYIADPGIRAAHGLGADSYSFVYADLQMVDEAMGPQQLWWRLLAAFQGQCRDGSIQAGLKGVLELERLDAFDLDEFFQMAGTKGRRVVFLLDEFDQVTTNQNFGPDFFLGFRALASRRNIALVTSSRMDLVSLCHSESVMSSPFFNIFVTINLGMFSPADFRALISTSLSETGVQFLDREIAGVLDLAGLHPYFLQVACYYLFEAHRQGMDAAARQAFMTDGFRAQAVRHFGYFWDKSSDPERITLTAAALLERQAGHLTVFSSEDLRRLYSRAEPSMASLEQRGLLMRASAGYRLVSSVLGRWILNQIVTELDDQQSFAEWLAQNKGSLDQVKGTRRKTLREVLPKVSPRYRQLIFTWLSDPQSVATVADLLKSALSRVS